MDTVLTPLEIGLRLLAATVAGMLIGINRDLKGKPTGMRTLALVCLGASLATVATVYLADIQQDPNALSRVVQGVLQGVLTGIAFLGAGAIIRKENSDETPGLTTAANVFVVAAIGIACGLGAWWAALFGWVLALIVLGGLHRVEKRLERMAEKNAPKEAKPLPPKPSLADPASPDHGKSDGR
jgi:putative Mg2+ transporter-C (MgtC) family protein